MDRTIKTRNSLPINVRSASIDILGAILTDSIDLALATKQAHWNIEGPRFIALHEMLDGFRTDLDVQVDTVAERIVQLGGTALGTTQLVESSTRLEAYPTDLHGEHDHLRALVDSYGAVADKVMEGVAQSGSAGDANTADILTGYSKVLDKSLWLLESHLEGP